KNADTKELLKFPQRVRTESAITEETFDQATAPDFGRVRAGLEQKNIDLMQGGLQDQSGSGKPPFIRTAGSNTAVPGRAPELASNTYTITPSLGAKKFRRSARPQSWEGLPTVNYFGY